MSSQVQAANQNLRSPGGQVPHGESQRGLRCVYPDLARGNDSWLVGVVVNFALFDGRRTQNDIRQAEAKLREFHARQQRLLLDIELGVRRTWLELEDAKQRLEVTLQTIGQGRSRSARSSSATAARLPRSPSWSTCR